MECNVNYEPLCTHRTRSTPVMEDRGQCWSLEQEWLQPEASCQDASMGPGMIGCKSDDSKINTRARWYCNAATGVVRADDKNPDAYAAPISTHIGRRRGNDRPPCRPIGYVGGCIENKRDSPSPVVSAVFMQVSPSSTCQNVEMESQHPMYPMFVLVFVCILVYLAFLAFL
jgi:hypothetical protein